MRVFVPSAAAVLTDHAGHGEGLIAWHLLSGLARRGHELTVCAREVDLLSDPPFEVIETGLASSLESIEPVVYALRMGRRFSRLGPQNFDLVHWIFPPLSPAGLLSRSFGLPLVVGPLATHWPRGLRTRRRRPGDLVQAVIGPPVDIVCNWQLAHAQAILTYIPNSPRVGNATTTTVPPGIDLRRYVVTAPPADPRIVFIGSLDAKKGIRELLTAFAAVKKALPSAELVLAGGGPEHDRIEQGMHEGVQLLGLIPHDEIPALLAGASLLCLPTHFEVYSMAILEAMAAGKAIVTTDAPGPDFLVDDPDGGRVVPIGDASGLATALIELLSDRTLLERLGAYNRRRVEHELTLDRAVERVEEVYRRVIE